jgi:hypothetical protein
MFGNLTTVQRHRPTGRCAAPVRGDFHPRLKKRLRVWRSACAPMATGGDSDGNCGSLANLRRHLPPPTWRAHHPDLPEVGGATVIYHGRRCRDSQRYPSVIRGSPPRPEAKRKHFGSASEARNQLFLAENPHSRFRSKKIRTTKTQGWHALRRCEGRGVTRGFAGCHCWASQQWHPAKLDVFPTAPR